MVKRYIITSESVTEGHPDKVCDQISDAILDDLLRQDPDSRVAVECLAKNGMIIIAGEVSSRGVVDAQCVARNTLKRIGYVDPRFGIDYEDAGILVSLSRQSSDIALGVDDSNDHEQGAGDQGMMYGYACNETEELMPFPIVMAHKLAMRLAEVRKKDIIDGLGPDGKTQVSVEYVDDKPRRISAVVVSQQHLDSVPETSLRDAITKQVILPVVGDWIDEDTCIHINATGRFVIGGPEGDAGLTGRKIVVDTYGGVGRVGGGCFSGKDPSKVDRSGAYMARYVAKNIVGAGLADRCEVQISYSIGVAEPTSVFIDTFGTSKSDDYLLDAVLKVFDMRPKAIIERLGLRRPVYLDTAAYGHFGREGVSWERLDAVAALKRAFK